MTSLAPAKTKSLLRPSGSKLRVLEEAFESDIVASASEESDISSPSNSHRRLTKTPVGMYDKVLAESIGSVQQAINTCNLASITLSLKGLGVSRNIDDIFSNLRLPVSWVIEQGLTLSQSSLLWSNFAPVQIHQSSWRPVSWSIAFTLTTLLRTMTRFSTICKLRFLTKMMFSLPILTRELPGRRSMVVGTFP